MQGTLKHVPCSVIHLQIEGRCRHHRDQLQPTGSGIYPVQVAVPQLEMDAPVRWMGKEQQHAKFSVTDGNVSAEAVLWNAAGRDLPVGRFDLAVQPAINSWRGRHSIQLKILDWRPAP